MEKFKNCIKKYINTWMEQGAGPQDHELFEYLALSMPVICTETVCIRNTENDPELLATRRDPEKDNVWGGLWHSIGSAHMLENYVNVHAIEEIKKKFPNVVERVKKDKTSWELNTKDAVMLRIFRRELGLPDDVCLRLISKAKFVGVQHDLTLRGGETALIYLVDITDFQHKITKEVSWITMGELNERTDFIEHQKSRVHYALSKWP